MRLSMLLQMTRLLKRPLTQTTHIGSLSTCVCSGHNYVLHGSTCVSDVTRWNWNNSFLLSVGPAMLLEMTRLLKRPLTQVTYIRSLPSVHAHVNIQLRIAVKSLGTNTTLKVFSSCMDQLVFLEVSSPLEWKGAEVTHESFVGVGIHVFCQAGCRWEAFLANFAYVISAT
jgi:hypothetical protein